MENITPTLILLWDVKRQLEKGQSITVGIQFFLQRQIDKKFTESVSNWFSLYKQENKITISQNLAPARCYLLEILSFGLQGQPILETLKSYEKELINSCEDEIAAHTAKLPILMLIPLMALIFPALMLLLIWPTLQSMQI